MMWKRASHGESDVRAAQAEGRVLFSEITWLPSGDPQLSLDCMFARSPQGQGLAGPVRLIAALPESSWLVGGLLAVLAEARVTCEDPVVLIRGSRLQVKYRQTTYILDLLAG